MLKNILAQNLRAVRRAAGLTQAQLAEAAEISLSTFIRIERGEGSCAIDKVEALAKALDIKPHTLLEATVMQELIAAIKDATDLDTLASAINDLADHVDGLGLGPYEKGTFYDAQIDHIVDWTELPRWGEMPADTRGIYSWDGARSLWLEDYRASLTDREDV